MATFGELVKKIPSVYAALGVIILVGISCASFGAAGNHFIEARLGLTARVVVLEEDDVKEDSITAEWRAESEGVMQEILFEIKSNAANDSIWKWEQNCLTRMMVEGREIDRYTCNPTTGITQ